MNNELEWVCLSIVLGAILCSFRKDGAKDLKAVKEVLPILIGWGLIGLVGLLAGKFLWEVGKWLYRLVVA